jgi:hypothetical protein
MFDDKFLQISKKTLKSLILFLKLINYYFTVITNPYKFE